ncbi:hypothetical protein, partial [uncultured Acidaminococcus sp.]|uniref:hypothetical protein n=1 Tax=uncultured Acidaminococcus sp. TaxID=352152 RepID=UPI00265FE8EC
ITICAWTVPPLLVSIVLDTGRKIQWIREKRVRRRNYNASQNCPVLFGKKVQEAALSYYNEDTYQDGLPPEKIRKNGCKIIH